MDIKETIQQNYNENVKSVKQGLCSKIVFGLKLVFLLNKNNFKLYFS